MGNPAWKKFERWVARKVFGTERSAHDRSDYGQDVLDTTGVLHIECKNYKSPAVNNWVSDAEAKADGKRAPLVFVHKKNRPYSKSTVTMRAEDFELIKDQLVEEIRKKLEREGSL